MISKFNDKIKNFILILMFAIIITADLLFKRYGIITENFYFFASVFLLSVVLEMIGNKINNKKARSVINVIYGVGIIASAILLLAYLALAIVVNSLLMIVIIKNGESFNGPMINNVSSVIIYFVYSIVFFIIYIIMNKKHKNSVKSYYKISNSYMCLCATLSYWLFVISRVLGNNIVSFVLLPICAIMAFILIIILAYYAIIHFNLAAYNTSYEGHGAIKKSITFSLEHNIYLYVGIAWMIGVGIIYLLASKSIILALYLGVFYLVMAAIRIGNHVWWMMCKNRSIKVSYRNQYYMMLYNAIFLFGLLSLNNAFLINNLVKGSTQDLTLFTVFQMVVITIRLVVLAIGYYSTRIRVIKEPYFLVSNSLSIVTFFLSAYTLVITLLIHAGYDISAYSDLYHIIYQVGYWIYILIAGVMAIRALVGLYKNNRRMDIAKLF